MGKRSLNEQLNWVVDQLNMYRSDRKVSRDLLEADQKSVDESETALSEAEKAWEKAKHERDKTLIEITHRDRCIENLEAEQRLIERKLTEIRIEKLAGDPEGPRT